MRANGPRPPSVTRLIRELTEIRTQILRQERRHPALVSDSNLASAHNLIAYLTFRRFDVRGLQAALADLGLSSLGRAESHLLYNLDSVLRTLHRLGGRPPPRFRDDGLPSPFEGDRRISAHAAALFRAPRRGRKTRIMVTAAAEAANQPALLRELLDAGMDCLRINCAHDDAGVWAAMIANLRRAERVAGRRCPVEMDLGGPRLRTGPIAAAPGVVKIRPKRDRYGRAVEAGHLWLLAEDELAPRDARPYVRVSRAWLRRRRPGATVRLSDARGARRELRLRSGSDGAREAETTRTTYLVDGTVLRAGGSGRRRRRDAASITVPPAPGVIVLKPGDLLDLSARAVEGRPAVSARPGRAGLPALVPVLPGEALHSVRVGARVWFDDGRIGGVVRSVEEGGVRVRVVHAASSGSKLRGEKGINFPGTRLGLPALTDRDRQDLDFVAANADLVGCSFVQSSADVEAVHAELVRRGRPDLPLILKIETVEGFQRLPTILLSALRLPAAGIMIARGDLAVEVGYERLAEVQEEILWLCEAAHVPVVWATQVLEELTKTGLPSRSEITDAAMGERAECVMLNKGPHSVEAVRVLDGILRRMEAHQDKKRARLRHLRVVESFFRAHRRRTDPIPPSGFRVPAT